MKGISMTAIRKLLFVVVALAFLVLGPGAVSGAGGNAAGGATLTGSSARAVQHYEYLGPYASKERADDAAFEARNRGGVVLQIRYYSSDPEPRHRNRGAGWYVFADLP